MRTALGILTNVPTDDLIEELKKRDYRCVHRDRIRTATSSMGMSKRHLFAFRSDRAAQENVIRSDLGQQLGHFLADHLPVEELPGTHHVDYRMTAFIIGPKVSGDDPDYFLPYRPLKG